LWERERARGVETDRGIAGQRNRIDDAAHEVGFADGNDEREGGFGIAIRHALLFLRTG
jgi:hypothetical protein